MEVRELKVNQIQRPLPRQTDQLKVKQLAQSIAKEGLQKPIDNYNRIAKYCLANKIFFLQLKKT